MLILMRMVMLLVMLMQMLAPIPEPRAGELMSLVRTQKTVVVWSTLYFVEWPSASVSSIPEREKALWSCGLKMKMKMKMVLQLMVKKRMAVLVRSPTMSMPRKESGRRKETEQTTMKRIRGRRER